MAVGRDIEQSTFILGLNTQSHDSKGVSLELQLSSLLYTMELSKMGKKHIFSASLSVLLGCVEQDVECVVFMVNWS